MITGLRRRAERDHEAIVGAVDASLKGLPPRQQLTGDEAYRVLFDLDTFLAELAAGGEFSVGVDPDGKGFIPGLQDPIRYVAVWAHDGGLVRAVGH